MNCMGPTCLTMPLSSSMVKPELHGEPPQRREKAPLGMLNVMAYRGNHPV